MTQSWIRVGGVCGVLSVVSYLAAAFAPLPDVASYAAAFAFGPLLAIGLIGLYHCLVLERRGPLVQIATIFGIAGGITVLLMLTVQQAIFASTKRTVTSDTAASEMAQTIKGGLNAVHFGLDIAWDVLISVAVILFAISMLRHPRFGRVMGGLGVVLGALLLSFNLWYFPTPPATANSIDWGPLVALWLLVAFLMLLLSGKWAESQTANDATEAKTE